MTDVKHIRAKIDLILARTFSAIASPIERSATSSNSDELALNLTYAKMLIVTQDAALMLALFDHSRN